MPHRGLQSGEGPKTKIEVTTPLSSWQQDRSFWDVLETRMMREVDLTSSEACHYERFTYTIAQVFRSARGRAAKGLAREVADEEEARDE